MAKFLNCTKEQFSSMGNYGNAKLANIMFAQGLTEYFSKTRQEAKSTSLHPGAVKSKFLSRSHTLGDFFSNLFQPVIWAFFKNTYEGTQTTLECTYRPYDELKSGQYYSECSEASYSTKSNPTSVNLLMKKSRETIETAIGTKLTHLGI